MLTDVVMPGMSGVELAKLLRQRYPALQILFTSGYTDDSNLRRDISEGHHHFIAKPFNVSSLTAKVRQMLASDEAE